MVMIVGFALWDSFLFSLVYRDCEVNVLRVKKLPQGKILLGFREIFVG